MTTEAPIRSSSVSKLQWCCRAGVAAFAALTAVAMARYPGGDSFGGRLDHHSMTRNYFCDLTAAVAPGGEPNDARRWAQAAMISLFFGLLAFWSARRARATTRLERWSGGLGVVSAVVALLVPLGRPTLGGADLHGAITLAAGVPGLVAAGTAVVASVLARRRLDAWLGALTLALGGVTAAIYVHFLATGATPRALPLAQKLAALALVAWLVHFEEGESAPG